MGKGSIRADGKDQKDRSGSQMFKNLNSTGKKGLRGCKIKCTQLFILAYLWFFSHSACWLSWGYRREQEKWARSWPRDGRPNLINITSLGEPGTREAESSASAVQR